MAEQQQVSGLFAKLGGRLAAANAQSVGKPVELSNRRLPPGIRNGIAKLQSMQYKVQERDDGKTPKGEMYWVAAAVVMSPEMHNGEKIVGKQTIISIPMCDTPKKGMREAKSFSEYYKEMRDHIVSLGIDDCRETDPQKIDQYWLAAMKALTNPKHPVYVSFSTRGWTPPATQQQPKPTEMVIEDWHGKAELPSNGQPFDPAAGVTSAPPSLPPATRPFNEFAPPPQMSKPPELVEPQDEGDHVYNIGVLVQVAMDDPDGATEEGSHAIAQLEETAWKMGWSKTQTTNAQNWAKVGEMCLRPPNGVVGTAAPNTSGGIPAIGSVWKFSKRTKEGAKLKNRNGEEFPPIEVRVSSVDSASSICHVESVKDSSPVVDVRTKQPIAVKFEWLESA